jgi:hypothetical protein
MQIPSRAPEVGSSSAAVLGYGEQRRAEIGSRNRKMRHIRQPRAGSGSDFDATPITLFSLPTTWRR